MRESLFHSLKSILHFVEINYPLNGYLNKIIEFLRLFYGPNERIFLMGNSTYLPAKAEFINNF